MKKKTFKAVLKLVIWTILIKHFSIKIMYPSLTREDWLEVSLVAHNKSSSSLNAFEYYTKTIEKSRNGTLYTDV